MLYGDGRLPAGTENPLLCTFSTPVAGLVAVARATLCPSLCTVGWQQPSPLLSPTVPLLGWLLQTLLGREGAKGVGEPGSPPCERVGKEGDAFGLPSLVAQSGACGWDPCAGCRELVRPLASLQLPRAAGVGVRLGVGGTPCAIALGAGEGRSAGAEQGCVAGWLCPAQRGEEFGL